MPSAPPAPIRSPLTTTREPASGSRCVTTNLSGIVRLRQIRSTSGQTADHASERIRRELCTSVLLHNLYVGNGIAPKLRGSRRKAIGLQHQRDDIPIGGFAERAGVAVRHVGADELEQIADRFLRETPPEWFAHQRRLAFRRKSMTTRAALAEGCYATGSLRLRVHTVPDSPARGTGLSGHKTRRA